MTSEQHEHEHGQEHGHDHGRTGPIRAFFSHSHDAGDRIDDALRDSREGIRALKISLVGLGITAVLQGFVVVISGSVALLGDTLHNLADALTALPLWFAFSLARRGRNRRYTYGYGRAEDVAGIAIVVAIAASAALAGWESFQRLLDPRDVDHLPVVMGAGVIGFLGNEVVARYRISVGRRIGSAALVADGLHARTDGFTSLAVVLGAVGVAVGWREADAVVGLLITLAILFVLKGAGRDVWHRLMDAVDPHLVGHAESVLAGVEGVEAVGDVRIRWIGHRMRAEVELEVDEALSVVDGHQIAERAHHALLHEVPKLSAALVHVSPSGRTGRDHHAETAHHLQ